MSLKYKLDAVAVDAVAAGGYTAGSGVLNLKDASEFEETGDYWVRADRLSEGVPTGEYNILKVSSRTGNALAVTGGQEGTSDINLAEDDPVRWCCGSRALDQLRADQNRVLTVAEFDALGAGDYKNGDRIRLSDSLYEAIRSGGGWHYFYGSKRVVRPPSADWSWDNQASSVIDSVNGYEYLSMPVSGTAAITVRYRAAPATPYTVKMLLRHDISGTPPGGTPSAASARYGPFFRNGDGKLIEFSVGTNVAVPIVLTAKWTNSTTASTNYTAYSGANAEFLRDFLSRNDQWLAISDDATNLKFYWSIDGLHWKLFDTRSRTDFFASGPNAYGFGGTPRGNAVELGLISLEETASGTP